MLLPLRPCVGIALVNTTGRIFAGQRIDGFPDAWQMPQGGIERGESPEEAALRELREETGVHEPEVALLGVSRNWLDYELPDELVANIWNGKFRGQTQKWFAYRLVADESAIDITASAEPEFRCWAWFEPEDLVERIVPFKRAVYKRVLAEFAPWLA